MEQSAVVDDAVARLAEEGYCVLENLIPPETAARLDELSRHAIQQSNAWAGAGYLSLEGALNRVPELAQLIEHPIPLAIAELVLGSASFEQYNNVALKWVRPGTGAGGLHADWPQNQVRSPKLTVAFSQ